MNGGGGVGHITDKVKGAAVFFRRVFGFFGEYGIAGCALLSLALEFVIECLSHKGIISALWFTISSAASDVYKRQGLQSRLFSFL